MRTLHWRNNDKQNNDDGINSTDDVASTDKTPLIETSDKNRDIESYADLTRMYASERQSVFSWLMK